MKCFLQRKTDSYQFMWSCIDLFYYPPQSVHCTTQAFVAFNPHVCIFTSLDIIIAGVMMASSSFPSSWLLLLNFIKVTIHRTLQARCKYQRRRRYFIGKNPVQFPRVGIHVVLIKHSNIYTYPKKISNIIEMSIHFSTNQ